MHEIQEWENVYSLSGFLERFRKTFAICMKGIKNVQWSWANRRLRASDVLDSIIFKTSLLFV